MVSRLPCETFTPKAMLFDQTEGMPTVGVHYRGVQDAGMDETNLFTLFTYPYPHYIQKILISLNPGHTNTTDLSSFVIS